MPRHSRNLALSGEARRGKLAQNPKTTATVVWICLPLGGVISNALFCVMEAEDWNLMPFP